MEQPGGSRLAQNATDMIRPMFGIINNASLPSYVKMYSPLMLCNEWPKIARLLFVLFCACFGTIMNGFFVSSFFVEGPLTKIGYIYLTCVGLADMLITAGVMPIIAVVLLSGQWDNLFMCRTVEIIAEAATYAYSWFFLMVAAEHFCWTCRTSEEYEIFLSVGIGLVSVLIFCLSFALAAVGVLFDLDYDYCERRSYGDLTFRVSTSVLFHGIFMTLTVACLMASFLRVKRRAREEVQYKRSIHYKRDYSLIALNLTAYLLFVVAWIPYFVVVNEFPSTSDALYYNTVWIGLLRSVFTSFIYGITHRNFRRAYGHVFNYCCCKSTLSGSFASRHSRGLVYKPATGDVRTPIMHETVSTNSPHRGASTSQDTQEIQETLL